MIRKEDLSQLRFVRIAVWVYVAFLAVNIFWDRGEDTASMTTAKVLGLVAGTVLVTWSLAAERRRHLRDLEQNT